MIDIIGGIRTLLTRLSSARAGYLDALNTGVTINSMTTAFTRLSGVAQVLPKTIDLNQAAGSYDLYTGTAQDVEVEALVIRMSGGAVAGAVTSISIQTDDATAHYFITAAEGVVANLTDQAQLSWAPAGGIAILKVGKKIRLTIAGGAAGVARVCDVVVTYRAVVSGGYLA